MDRPKDDSAAWLTAEQRVPRRLDARSSAPSPRGAGGANSQRHHRPAAQTSVARAADDADVDQGREVGRSVEQAKVGVYAGASSIYVVFEREVCYVRLPACWVKADPAPIWHMARTQRPRQASSANPAVPRRTEGPAGRQQEATYGQRLCARSGQRGSSVVRLPACQAGPGPRPPPSLCSSPCETTKPSPQTRCAAVRNACPPSS
ncbi:uncharacterized protein PSFLO_03479 [Pseudozyma flocculosa]|uniref:Uncharacterized protein n=1 Tax=Pseudozyma flocculosa TaxID=84751 RepID=A0A5C3F132_9BASI|nr:uncharacterized protein PSFLO_03479 [Pseudozyma flocculosa]